MLLDSSTVLTQRVRDVAFWCSLQKLAAFHDDSPDEARRRELIEEANRLFDNLTHKPRGWLQRLFSTDESYKRAMELLRQAEPDKLAPLEHQLRNPVMKPSNLIDGIGSEECSWEIVEELVRRRSSLLSSQSLSKTIPEFSGSLGRLLLYVPSENVSDGASKFASKGFFDENDCPPWDLWLLYSDRSLISWVPEILYPLAQAGIDANPVECIRWAD